jgi:ATP-binding cassette, subfamily C (CFTR/MRP), member 1
VSLINVHVPSHPEAPHSLLSKLSFNWLGPFLEVGFSRPLEKEGMSRYHSSAYAHLNLEYLDLWDLPDSRLTSSLATEVEENFYARCEPDKRPEFYGSRSSPSTSPKEEETVPELKTPLRSDDDSEKGQKETSQPNRKSWFQMKPKTFKTDSEGNRKYDSSLLKALHRTFFVRWWTGGLLVLIAGGLH